MYFFWCTINKGKNPHSYFIKIYQNLVLAVKRGVLDQKVNVQCHDFFCSKVIVYFLQNGLFLVLVLGLGGSKVKIWPLYLPPRIFRDSCDSSEDRNSIYNRVNGDSSKSSKIIVGSDQCKSSYRRDNSDITSFGDSSYHNDSRDHTKSRDIIESSGSTDRSDNNDIRALV